MISALASRLAALDAALRPIANRPVDITQPGWADETPYNFFATWLTCVAAYNHHRFCDPAIDRGVRRAQALESTNPRSASELWAELDRKVVDGAAWVPLVNPRHVDLVSKRVRNYQHHAVLGVIADQLEPS